MPDNAACEALFGKVLEAACEAIAGAEHWTLWGVSNCGQGQPEQVMGTGQGASPSRFRIRIGSACAG